jgi:hypothetical protein
MSKIQKQTRLQIYNTLAITILLYGPETWTQKEQHKSRITAEEMNFFRKPTKYTLFDHKRNHNIFKELKTQPVMEEINNYNSKWIHCAQRMDRLMQTVRKYALIGKRNAGHPLKRLLRT